MSNFPCGVLSSDEIETVAQDVIDEALAGRKDAAWDRALPLRKALRHQSEAVDALLWIVGEHGFSPENAIAVLTEIGTYHAQDVGVMAELGESLEAIRDVDDLNAPPPGDAIYYTVVEKLAAFAGVRVGLPEEEAILHGLGTAARMVARQRDEIAENCYRRLTELNPRKCANHYNLGLFFKTRGRFEEGVQANQKAISLADGDLEPYQWNLGICATGAGNAALALDLWKRMGQKIEMGRFGLPEGGYPQCKVKLAERPLAERSADMDDPGLEETVWIERLSPCHGVIRSVLYENLGVDYGDVVLFDGAPVAFHTYGDAQIPVFPHLATLIRRNYQFYDFAGTQEEPRQLADISADLQEDTVVYSHSENIRVLCRNCWRDPDVDHADRAPIEKCVVTGRIAAPPHIAPAHLLEQLDEALAKRGRLHLYAPELCEAAGLNARTLVEKRRFDMLEG